MLSINPGFVSKEDIVAKLQYIEHLEHLWPYSSAQGRSYYDRVSRTLRSIDSKYHEFALALFANVIYLTESLRKDTWSYLLGEMARRFDITEEDAVNESILFECNGSGMLYDFMNKNMISGRLDSDRYPRINTVQQLIESMLLFTSSTNITTTEGLRKDIKFILQKRFWILLVDNALSGTSLRSELERASQILGLLKPVYSVPKIIPLIQVYTVDAKSTVEAMLNQANIIIEPPIWALYFDSKFKIYPGNEGDCELFAKQETFNGVIELCQWFAKQSNFANDPELVQTKKRSGDDLAFGFKAGGWTIVTSPNCPTNSLPLLWYSKRGFYEGPFPRVHSRISQSKGRGGESIDALLARQDDLLKRLEA